MLRFLDVFFVRFSQWDIVQRNNLSNNPIDFEDGSDEDEEDLDVIARFSFRKKFIERSRHIL